MLARASSPYLQQLEFISSPVPDLAATLTTDADTIATNDTISFLRTRLPGDTDLPLPEEQPPVIETEETSLWEERDTRLEDRRDFDIGMSGRIPILREDDDISYANRVPQRQSLYDWAPGSDDEDLYQELLSRANIPTFAQSARSQSRHLNLDSHRRSHSRSEIRARDDNSSIPPSWAGAARRGNSPTRADPTISTTALLQSVEQHRRFNARARSTLQSYILDRDRRENETTPSALIWARLHRSEQQTPGSPYPAMRNLSSQADLRSAYRQLFLENRSITRLKNSIRYLSKLRRCDTIEEGLTLVTDLAIDDACGAGPSRPTDRFSNLPDLIIDTSALSPVAECSWLTPGTIFTGSQHTSRDPPPVMVHRNRDRDAQSRVERYRQDPLLALHDRQRRRSYARTGTYRDRLPVPDASITLQHGFSNTALLSEFPNPQQTSPQTRSRLPSDHWPVTITLHDICPYTQTLSGTMSATHIPNKMSPSSPTHNPHGSSMQSFFEGEIIDFKTHSLQTENFCTGEEEDGDGGVSVDARYWRGVGPFRELLERDNATRGSGVGVRKRDHELRGQGQGGVGGDDEDEGDDMVEDALGGEDIIASHLRSRSWIENVLLREWVLMRWKERCFIQSGADIAPSENEAQPRNRGGGTEARAQAVHPVGTGSGTRNANGSIVSTDPASWGLTISGFYYVALRRQTGDIDGLYYDPGSLPFQVLELRPEGRNGGHRGDGTSVAVKGRWPAQQFR